MASVNGLIKGDDDLPAEEVGAWAKEKHCYVCRYVDISSATRKKFLGTGKAGATYIDLFCGPGRSRVRETGEWIDGSAIAAWKIAQTSGSSFSEMWVADIDDERRAACAKRLKQLGAPVKELAGSAVVSAKTVAAAVNQYGLHAAFLDPYNLGELDFSIINALSQLKRIDMLIHVSAMDLQRNLERNLAATNGPFDVFAPGWRDAVNTNTSQTEVRRLVVEYWRAQVAKLGVWPSIEMKLITGEKNQRLYWLLLAAKHDLAHSFWEVAANAQGQGKLF